MAKKPVAIQMWTLRDELKNGLSKTLQRAAQIGYEGVELWFPGPFPPVKEMKTILAEANLKVAGAHVPLDAMTSDFPRVADYHREIGNRNLVVPHIPAPRARNEDDWKSVVKDLAAVGRKCADAGFRLAYHNHSIEFEMKVGGIEVHDYIFSSVPADLLAAELDTYFIQFVGKNPAQYVRKFSGRVPLLHLKDVSKTPEKYKNAEIGRGTIDWDSVFKAAEEAGVEWHIVEQNCDEYPTFESIRMSLDYLKSKAIA